MPLATAEETTIVIDFPSAMAYGDFMQNAKFVVMYNGAIQTLTPTADSTGGKVSAPDTQMIAYWREWETPAQQKQITLAPGRADWRLIAIYTDGDVYQLKPQDLIGLAPSNNPGDIVNPLLSGNTVPFVLNNYLFSVRYSSTDKKAYFKVCPCNPEENDKAAKFLTDDWVISSYSCETFNSSARADDISDFLIGIIGLQPQQLTEVVFEGSLSSVPMPLIIYEI